MAIVRNARFCVLRDQTHILLLPTLQYSFRRIDIVLYVDGVCMLVNIVIVDPHELIWFCVLLFLVGLWQ